MSHLANLEEIDSSLQSLSLILNKNYLVIQSLCIKKDCSRHYAVTASASSI